MERLLRPERFEADPHSPSATEQWLHWYQTFENFLSSIDLSGLDKRKLLVNFISPAVYQHVLDCHTYEEAIRTLKALYVKPKNEIFARHLLATAKQEPGQSVDQFLQKLRTLATDCNFTAVTAEKHCGEAIRDAFITGLHSNDIRLRLLEKQLLDLQQAFSEARMLEHAQHQSRSYACSQISCGSTSGLPDKIDSPKASEVNDSHNEADDILAAANNRCFFCGRLRHPRSKCPAREAICNTCGEKGYFEAVCRSDHKSKHTVSVLNPIVSSTVASS